MKKELKKDAQTAAQTATNGNETADQVINTNETESTKTDTPESETETPTPQTEQTAPTPPAETEKPKTETIEELQTRLDAELSKLNIKKRLARHRETFINSMGSLQIYIDQLKNENEFETKSGKISFKVLETDHYDRSTFVETFSISNTELINKFCNMLLCEMREKKTELETQLLTA